MTVTVEDILKLDDAHRLTVRIPEWHHAELLVVSMTALERAELEKRWAKKDAGADPGQFRADVLERSLKKPGRLAVCRLPGEMKRSHVSSAGRCISGSDATVPPCDFFYSD